MASTPSPGPLFARINTICKELVRERVVFTSSKPLGLDLFDVPFEWIAGAIQHVRAHPRLISEREYWEPAEPSPCFTTIQKMRLEVISAGDTVVLLLNTCPIAEVDLKGDFGLAIFFDMPPMEKEEWETWEFLGASTTRIEIVPDPEALCLRQIKEEEGKVNTLRLCRDVNLLTGDSELSVSCDHHQFEVDPTVHNLFDWIEVRAGRAHPALLKVEGRRLRTKWTR